jgi:hemerythrin
MPSPSQPPIISFKPWSEADYCIGIDFFDHEHRHLARLIEELHEAAVIQRDTARALELFGRITQEARSHFVHEEELLQHHGYEELEGHTEQHSILLKQIQDMQRSYASGSVSALLLTRFLQSWLVDHIRTADRDYCRYLKRKRLA